MNTSRTTYTSATIARASRNAHLWMFILSALIILTELVVIRFVSTEIRIFAYVQNAVLVVCFLGIGMGCLIRPRQNEIRNMQWAITLLVLLISLPFFKNIGEIITRYLSVFEDFVIWSKGDTTGQITKLIEFGEGILCTFGFLLLVWRIFLTLGILLGKGFRESPHGLSIYLFNLAGSIAGSILFAVLTSLWAPPYVWFGIIWLLTILLVLVEAKLKPGLNLIIPGLITILALLLTQRYSGAIKTIWSPYQKLALIQGKDDAPGATGVFVNNSGYQLIVDLSAKNLASQPKVFDLNVAEYAPYNLPFKLFPNPKKVLIVGAGTGNDVAGAIRNGAESITAVEIDPAIVELGKAYHPEQPYANSKVNLVVDDARAFFSRSKDKFDVIIFGLLDSHTTTSLTNVRLDHYLYTTQSLELARNLLAPKGALFLKFEARFHPFIADRLATTLEQTFKTPPRVLACNNDIRYGVGGVMFIEGNLALIDQQISKDAQLSKVMEEGEQTMRSKLEHLAEPTTDDWPYLYLKDRSIPILYYFLAGIVIAIFLYTAKRENLNLASIKFSREHLHFLSLGAAFLLLETYGITRASVALANTWSVNTIVISALLLMNFLGTMVVVSKIKPPTLIVFALLLASCIMMYFIDFSSLGSQSTLVRYLVVSAVLSIPALFSGIAFAQAFERAKHKEEMLGINLFGALLGGILQSLSLVFGLHGLLVIALGFYLVAASSRSETSSKPGA